MANARHSIGVMRGLDPRIHDARQFGKTYESKRKFIKDGQVKPGNDR